MKKFLKLIRGSVIVFVCLFLFSLIVYFFNLDMKLVAKLEPVLQKHYDRVKKDKE